MDELAELIEPDVSAGYSSAEELVHLVLTDSPGRAAFWGAPNVEGAAPVLMARSDDLEIILHHEPDGPLGLLLFAQAIERRVGESMSMDILDEYSTYLANERSFYLSDDRPADFTIFQVGDGLNLRLKFADETDRHGVVIPRAGLPIVQVHRRYARDTPEVFISLPNSAFIGSVIEIGDQTFFVELDLGTAAFLGVEPDLLDCVAYWVRECAVVGALRANSAETELKILVEGGDRWKKATGGPFAGPAVNIAPNGDGYDIRLGPAFAAGLQEADNRAEQELVRALLTDVFEVTKGEIESTLQSIAPLGPKRMITIFTQDGSPDMLAAGLPRALVGHDQVGAQLLDALGEWLRSPSGGENEVGEMHGGDRVRVLNAAVGYLFGTLEEQIAFFDKRALLDYLILQSEALLHRARVNSLMLGSRLACFGEQSDTVADLVSERNEVASAHRASRFLIEYVAAMPPSGTAEIGTLAHYRLLAVSKEIIDRATTSDFLHYELADFQISILASGRLGTSRDEAITRAMDTYAANAGTRSVRRALGVGPVVSDAHFDGAAFLEQSASAMSAEFGFTLSDLREVCGGLLDLATADGVTRVNRASAIAEVASSRGLEVPTVSSVIAGITLERRDSFLEIKSDAWPWRFNRDKSYVRRPLIQQGDELVFGFRSVYRLGQYWMDGLLSGRLQGRAATLEMRQFISAARGRINDDFARSVESRLQELGFVTRLGVKKVGKQHLADSDGRDLGDVDVLALHAATRTIIGVEAKDFEIARTPPEIANELDKLFVGSPGKKATIDLHGARVAWLKEHVPEVLQSMGGPGPAEAWAAAGIVVTSEPLLSPLVHSSALPVIPLDDLDIDSIPLQAATTKHTSRTAGRKRR